MHLRCLLIVMLLAPALAAARSRMRSDLAATIEPGLHAGRLVITARGIDPADNVLVIELANATVAYTLRLAYDGSIAAIDLDPYTRDVAPGAYEVVVRWGGATARAHTNVPHRCGLRYESRAVPPRRNDPAPTSGAPPAGAPSSSLPDLLGALAIVGLLGALGLRERAGTAEAHVPDCVP